MGPHLNEDLNQLREFRAAHPEIIISYPSETPSGLWEVSLPEASCMAFDSVSIMMRALSEVYPEVAETP